MSQPSGQPCQRMKGKAISQLTNPDKLQNLTLSQTPRPIELAKATCHQMEWKVTSRIRQTLFTFVKWIFQRKQHTKFGFKTLLSPPWRNG